MSGNLLLPVLIEAVLVFFKVSINTAESKYVILDFKLSFHLGL